MDSSGRISADATSGAIDHPLTGVDVAVLGGGPAGCAAALTLLTYSSLCVAVVERSTYDTARVGETLPPGVQPLLAYLGVDEPFLNDGHLPAFATYASWGSPHLACRDFLFTGRGDGWHVDRSRFDRLLAQEVQRRGGILYTGAHVGRVHHDDGWQIVLVSHDGSEAPLTARFVIDATGSSAAFARTVGARRQVFDHLIGVAGYYDRTAPTPAHVTVIESVADGWWYSAPLPAGRMVVTFMSDATTLRTARASTPAGWASLLEATSHTRRHVGAATLAGPLIVRPASSHLLSPAAGLNWVAAGDAVAAFDPLASMGIGHALSSGIHAARVAHQEVTAPGRGQTMAQYKESVGRNVTRYLRLREQYYRLEQRWADRPFWARRHHARSGHRADP